MYEHVGDHLQAEFDRILFALSTLSELPVRLDGTSEPESESASGRQAQPGGRLTTVGTRVRSLAGDKSDATSETATDIEEFRDDIRAKADEIESRLEDTRETDTELRLDRLTRVLGLSRPELDVLLLALAPVFDRSVYRLYGKIQGTSRSVSPTLDLLETVLVAMGRQNDGAEPQLRSVLSQRSPLFEYRLLERYSTDPSHPDTFDVVTVDERIVNYLKGDDSLGPALADRISIEHHDRTLSELVFDEETTETLEAIHARTNAADVPTIYYFSGEDGTGKDRLPGALTDSETPILRANAADVLEDEDLTTRLIREAALQEAAIHLEGLETVTGHDEGPTIDEEDGDFEITTDEGRTVDEIVERLDDAPGDVFLSHTDEWKPDVDLETHRVETAHCPFPEYDTRLAIWQEYREEIAADYLLENVATNFRLPQRDIRRAVKTARYLCRTDGDAADVDPAALEDGDEPDSTDVFAPVDGALERDHLYEACKRYSASNLEALAEPMEPGYSFEDIYLNDKPKTHLRELCGHLQYRGQVTSEWGFGEPGDRGDGVVAMFYGPPGTGKTMAAEIIATETGLDLYRVDLSQIVNKYVGETESRLAALLEEAERSNAILLFDEADSLFGERTDVGDSSDRYANNVTNFLLQRLESFDGIALLTTNKRSGIDPAFKRRIAHSILFDVPQERVRRRIWRNVFPDEASVDTSDFDYEWLGRIVVTPAVVRKIATYAAYIAATEAHDGNPLADSPTDFTDVTITFDHVILALQYASEAGGVAIEGDFSRYEDKLRSYENQGVSREWEDELSRRYGDETDSSANGSGGTTNGSNVEDGSSVDGERTRTPPANADGGEDVDPDSDAGFESNAETPSDKRPASSVDPADGRSPEAVVTEFVSRLADGDDSAHEFYHSRTIADEFTSKDLAILEHGEISIVSDIERVRDAHDRVVLRLDQELDTEKIPEPIEGVPENATYELRPEEGEGWRIFSISGR